MERLSHVIDQAVQEGDWEPIKLSPSCPPISHLFYADDLILFSSASVGQASTILRCLDEFGIASGLSVNKSKSLAFCSKNSGRRISSDIASTLGIPLTQDLGHYLGVPILHGRTTKGTYQGIIDKLDQKLSGWKAKSLSLAGRVTLAQSALSAIPIYAMQTSVLPVTTCDAIDRRIRNFVWGSTTEEKKMHLVAWDQVCKPKSLGGLGLRQARILNQAYMIKLAFIFFQKSDVLWVQVLQSKYFKDTTNDMIQQVTGMIPPAAGRGDDVLNWGEEANGKFSIRSAYCLTLQFDHQPLDIDWKHVWRWKGPSRTQHFLWLAMHNKLLTNPWSLLGFHTNGSAQKPLNKWLSDGMEHKDGMLFGISCWYLWKGRNELVFSAKIQSPRDLAARISSWTGSVSSALDHDKTIGTQIPSRTAAIINWDPGPEGWITLNTDGSVNRATGVATIGGLLRNHLGFCSLAFTAKLGKCSITRAELRGIIQGLELAWNEGHKKVSVQTDSLAAVLLIRAEGAPSHQHTSEIIAIKNWTDRDWQVEFHHIYREANGAADFLATLGHHFAIGVHIIPTSDCNLGYFLRKDCMRIAELRSIPIIN
ncbi:Putative ribonuclease H protein At1g65750 [Linum perenne]